MPFVKGQSGNPGGRRKGKMLKTGIRERMTKDEVLYWKLVDATIENAIQGQQKALETVRSALDGPEVKMIATAELTTEQILDVLAADDADEGEGDAG